MTEERAQTVLLGIIAIFAFITAGATGFMAYVLWSVMVALRDFGDELDGVAAML